MGVQLDGLTASSRGWNRIPTMRCTKVNHSVVRVIIHTLAIVSQCAGSATKFNAVLDTKAGKISGLVAEDGAVTRFLGIPYAKAPVGKLRFLLPEPHPGWAFGGTFNASSSAPECPQSRGDVLSSRTQSEDCLNLDILVPRNLSAMKHINTLAIPVVFYISEESSQGGRLTVNVEPEDLAIRGDLIVARVRYRVGILGYLSLGNTEVPGNAGLWDQRMALHWVWDNIREFGGDPERITLFGDSSGGGESVGFHILSPRSRGFFTKAVSQGGNFASRGSIQHNPAKAASSLAEITGCPAGKNLLICLQNLNLHSLQAAASRQSWLPVIDGEFLPDTPLRLIRDGALNSVDYLLGSSDTDTLHLLKNRGIPMNSDISVPQFEQIVHSTLREFYKEGGQQLFLATLLEYSSCSVDAISRFDVLVTFFKDSAFRAPIHLAARAMADKNKNVYVYQLSDEELPLHARLPATKDQTSLGTYGVDSSNVDKLKQRVMTAWINFIKNSDPNPFNEVGVYWKPFERNSPRYLQLDISLSRESPKSGFSLRKMAFWNDYVPALLETTLLSSGECAVFKEVCSQETRQLEHEKSTSTTTVWALTGVCVVLLIALMILIAKQCFPRSAWEQCKPRGRTTTVNETERRKLQPLPYYDET